MEWRAAWQDQAVTTGGGGKKQKRTDDTKGNESEGENARKTSFLTEPFCFTSRFCTAGFRGSGQQQKCWNYGPGWVPWTLYCSC